MDEKVREALERVPDAYDDFVNAYTKDLRGDTEKQKFIIETAGEKSLAIKRKAL